MFNRLAGILRWFDPELVRTTPDRKMGERIVFEAVKGILACGDSILLLHRMYHYSYRHRLDALKRVQERYDISGISPGLLRDFEAATLFKLSPSFDKYLRPLDVWFAARDHLLNTIWHYWQKCAGHRASTREDFPRMLLELSRASLMDYLGYNHSMIRRLGSLKAMFKLRSSYADIVRSSLFCLALAIKQDRVDESFLEHASSVIRTIVPVSAGSGSASDLGEKWRYIRDRTDLAWSFCRK
jgi:hypothetical protein